MWRELGDIKSMTKADHLLLWVYFQLSVTDFNGLFDKNASNQKKHVITEVNSTDSEIG